MAFVNIYHTILCSRMCFAGSVCISYAAARLYLLEQLRKRGLTLFASNFWATVCKTFRLMLIDRCLSVCLFVCLSCLSLCDVGVLWPNAFMHQVETWHAGRTRPWPYCVRWGPASVSPKGHNPSPIFDPYLLWPNSWMYQDATW